jgi:hypothetical protein
MADRPKIISTERARGAVRIPAMRYVLIISVVLAVAAMAWAFLRAPVATEPDTSAKVSAVR